MSTSETRQTDWQQSYRDQVLTPEQAVAKIKPGQRVFIGTSCATPQALVRALAAHAGELADTEIVHMLSQGDAPYASLKIFLAITLLVLTAAIAVARWRQPEMLWKPSTMVLYLLAFVGSFAIAIALGFLGGVILYGF